MNRSIELDHLPNQISDGEIIDGCLVIEGGAFRNAYAAGVLDLLMEQGIHIKTVVGVSGGALCGMNYITKQIGRTAQIILEQRFNKALISLRNLFLKGGLFNIDFTLKDNSFVEHLDVNELMDSERELVVVATNIKSGKPEYFKSHQTKDFFSAIKASASMQYVSSIINVDGKKCLDGACSIGLAYQWALDHCFEKIIVLRTRDRNFRKPNKPSLLAGLIYWPFPKFAKTLAFKEINYNKQCEEVLQLEESGRIFMIAPEERVKVKLLEPDVRKIADLYVKGYTEAQKQIDKLVAYLKK